MTPSRTAAEPRPNISFSLTLFIVVFCGIPVQPVAAQAPQENRFLFIIETSQAMRNCAKAAQEVAVNLLSSGVDNRMQAGDTFGVWTYDEDLRTGEFPMQQWHPDNRGRLAAVTGEFLKKQRHAGSANLRAVLPAMLSVIDASQRLTVILISDGQARMERTPFDAEINAVFEKHSGDLRESRIPFVTVLAAADGKIIDYTVSSSIGPIRIPQLPPPAPVPEPTVAAPPERKPEPRSAPRAAPVAPQEPKPATRTARQIVVPKDEPVKAPAVELPKLATEPVQAPPLVFTPSEDPVAYAATAPETSIPGNTAVAPTDGKNENEETGGLSAPAARPEAQESLKSVETEAIRLDQTSPGLAVATSPRRYLIVAILLFMTAGVLGWAIRRARMAGHPSLISRSMDRRDRGEGSTRT